MSEKSNEIVIQMNQLILNGQVLHYLLTSHGRVFGGIAVNDEEGGRHMNWQELELPPLYVVMKTERGPF